jgi:DME family drug/metabolite transporter
MGELVSLGSAVMWACSTIAMRAESGRVPALALNAFRSGFASLVIWLIVLALGDLALLPLVPPSALGSLIASVLIGMAVGDSLNIRAMHAIGVARAMPISSTYPLLTAILAVVVLGEPLPLRVAAGIVLVILGVALVAFPRRMLLAKPSLPTGAGDREPHGEAGRGPDSGYAAAAASARSDSLPARDGVGLRAPTSRAGVAMALGASLCWASSAIIMRPASELVDPLIANAVRLPIACLVLIGLSLGNQRRRPSPVAVSGRSVAVLAVAGCFSAVSGACWLFGLRYAGAAKAATLSSTAPVFAAPLAVLFLGERLSLQTGLGILLTVVGVALVV